MKDESLLQMVDVSLSFGRVRVLDGASLNVAPGEVHGLLGENGAGKSSLMKVLFGLYRADQGEIVLRGQPVEIPHARAALAHGIAMIHQELPFAGHLTVAQNLYLGREPRTGVFRFIDERLLNERTASALARFPVQVDPRTPMRRLSIAQQQIVAIAKALETGAGIVVLDEATTALTDRECDQLFGILETLAREGTTFIMITHRLDDVFRLADRVTVMRDGKTVAAVRTADVSPQDLVHHMVGREVEEVFPARTAPGRSSDAVPRLSVRNLSTRKLRDISFDLWPGEVLGVAGLMGAGRTSLFNALFGVDPLVSGHIEVDGRAAHIDGPRSAINLGMAYITEDRKANGLALRRGLRENVTLARLHRHTRSGLLKDRELDAVTQTYASMLSIDARAGGQVGVLSGGNQQKVVLAKWLATGADIFLLDEPTRGIDVGTKLEVYDLINALTAEGKAVLLVTSELPELMAMSDHFIVLSEGSVVRELSREEATPDQVVYYASSKP